ncbi:MAG: LysE family translocator [Pseudomonadota bacterium]
MELINIISFTLVAALLVVSPGPNGVLIAKTVPSSGRSAGFANIAGFVVAFFIHGSLSILGISILLVQSAQAFFLFKMIGAAYLCWIGIKSLLEAWHYQTPHSRHQPRTKSVSMRNAFFEGLLTNALNPKVSMFYLAAFPQFMPTGGVVSSAFLLVSIHALINVIWFSAMVLLIARIQQLAGRASFTRWLKSVTGAVFLGFGVKLASLRMAD